MRNQNLVESTVEVQESKSLEIIPGGIYLNYQSGAYYIMSDTGGDGNRLINLSTGRYFIYDSTNPFGDHDNFELVTYQIKITPDGIGSRY